MDALIEAVKSKAGGGMKDVTRESVEAILDYRRDLGRFYWKPREADDFGSSRLCNTFNSNFAGKLAGRMDSYGYRQIRVAGKQVLAHRLVWLMETGEWPSGEIDHINHDRDDNRAENLRVVGRTENCRNASIQKNNKTGVHGVWLRNNGRYQVTISDGGKLRYLGSYADIFDAYCARKSAESSLGYHPNHGA